MKFYSKDRSFNSLYNQVPTCYRDIFKELIFAENDSHFFHSLVKSLIDVQAAIDFIMTCSSIIPYLVIDTLHIVGDIYDRGPRPDAIIDQLNKYKHVDIQWGNHDISWLGAFCGNEALIANVIRNAIRYNHFDLLEISYGINLRPLNDFARMFYKNDKCLYFYPKEYDQNSYDSISLKDAAKMHKAITIIQLKLESQIIEKHPEFKMDNFSHIKFIDFNTHLYKQSYQIKDCVFPTVSRLYPSTLTKEEVELMRILKHSFLNSVRLKKHMSFLFNNGSTYKITNNKLLFHGCIPMKKDSTFQDVRIGKHNYSGRALLETIDQIVKNAFIEKEQESIDYMWYFWCGRSSPFFGKTKLNYFETYFLLDVDLHKEELNPYYSHMNERQNCKKVLKEFNIDCFKGCIINGHVPVLLTKGESPIKGSGSLIMIDGGFAKSYHDKTGHAGYTLISTPTQLMLATHQIDKSIDMSILAHHEEYKIKDTEDAKHIHFEIKMLYKLLTMKRNGEMKKIAQSSYYKSLY